MLQLFLIVLADWVGLSLVSLPFVLLFGRAGRRADADAARLHAELVTARRDAARAARATRHRAART